MKKDIIEKLTKTITVCDICKKQHDADEQTPTRYFGEIPAVDGKKYDFDIHESCAVKILLEHMKK